MADVLFRVSDVAQVPLRGWLLRLKLLEGDLDPRMLKPGKRLRLIAADGESLTVTVKDFSVTAGKQKKERVDAYREFDVVIPAGEVADVELLTAIGWHAEPAA